jgi:hypothetical protein
MFVNPVIRVTVITLQANATGVNTSVTITANNELFLAKQPQDSVTGMSRAS